MDYAPELGNVPLIFGELMTHERCSSLIQEMFQYTLILSSFPKHLISRVPTEYWRCLVPIEEAVAVTGAAEAVLVPAGSLECDREDPHQVSLTHTLAHGRLHSSWNSLTQVICVDLEFATKLFAESCPQAHWHCLHLQALPVQYSSA